MMIQSTTMDAAEKLMLHLMDPRCWRYSKTSQGKGQRCSKRWFAIL